MAILAESLQVPVAAAAGRARRGRGLRQQAPAAYLLICALLARQTGRPVKWIEDRLENLTALMHAANGVMDVELAYRADGKVLGLRVRDIADEGKNLVSPAQHNLLKLGNIANGYGSRDPLRRTRGAHQQVPERSQPRHRQALHVLRDRAGHGAAGPAPGAGPADIRLRTTSSRSTVHDAVAALATTADYPATLNTALARFDYAGWRAEQRPAGGRLLGIGLATSVEPAGTNLASYELVTGRRAASGSAEAAMVRVEPDRAVRAAIGNPASGQGYETVIAQIIADELGVAPTRVQVERGFDSATTPWLFLARNYANKFSVTDVGAVVGAARAVRPKLLKIAAHRLEVAPEDLELREGARVRGVPGRALSFTELARTRTPTSSGSPGWSRGWKRATRIRIPRPSRWTPSAGCARGSCSPMRPTSVSSRSTRGRASSGSSSMVVHDCGRELNPMIVEGMVHIDGARPGRCAARGVPVRRARSAHDRHLHGLPGSRRRWTSPTSRWTAWSIPRPSRRSVPREWARGAIPGPAAVANAVEDALAHLGVVVRSLPITPERVCRWLGSQTSKSGS